MDRHAVRPAAPIDRRRFIVGGLAVGTVALTAGRGRLAQASRAASTSPTSGGALRIGIIDVPPDYLLGTSGAAWGANYQSFAWPLFHGGTADGLTIENALAGGYEPSDDLMTHTITLRDGMTFHDGSPITAEAVAECLRSHLFADHPLRDDGPYNHITAGFGSPPNVASIDVVDDLSFATTLVSPRYDIRGSLTQTFIYNPAVIAREGYGTDPGALRDVGTGPFRVTDFQPSTFLELERFDGFFTDVFLDALRFQQFDDASAMALALRAGDIDAGYGLSKSDHEDLADDPNFTLSVYEPSFNVFWRFAPPKTPELEDPRVREAIILAMNRPVYRDAFFSAGTAQATAMVGVHPDRPGYADDLEERPYDPERARELLAEAGAEGMAFRMTGYPSAPQIPEQGSMLEAMASDLENVGIDASVNIVDVATWSATRFEYDMWFSAFSPESSGFVFSLLYSPPAQLEGVWPESDPRSHPDVARLLTEGAAATTPEDEDRIYQELSTLEHDELLMGCPVAQVSSSLVAWQGVHDLRVTTLGPAYERAWVESSA